MGLDERKTGKVIRAPGLKKKEVMRVGMLRIYHYFRRVSSKFLDDGKRDSFFLTRNATNFSFL